MLRYFYIFCLLCSFSFVHANHRNEPIHFHIVIPSYNNSRYVEKNLDSVFSQSYRNWTLSYMNDASSDDTGKLAQNKIARSMFKKKCKIVHNKTNLGPLRNIYLGSKGRPGRDVIVILDGDDQLAHPYVLKRVAQEYVHYDAWITYGTYIGSPGDLLGVCEQFPEEVVRNNDFRAYKWVSSHLRTYYAELFYKVEKRDFFQNGAFGRTCADLFTMFPMLEMASKGHIRYIPDILYLYNVQNPLGESRIRRMEQSATDQWIRNKRRYKPLQHLF